MTRHRRPGLPLSERHIASEMLRYFRDQTTDLEERLFMKALARIQHEGLKADELESQVPDFSMEERRRRFRAEIRHGSCDDLQAKEFRYVLLKEPSEKRMALIAGKTPRHSDLYRRGWVNSGGGFISVDFPGDRRLDIIVSNRSWTSAIASESTENYNCIRACLETYVSEDALLSSMDVSISIMVRGVRPFEKFLYPGVPG